MKPTISIDILTTEFESKFLNVFQFPFGKSGHYYTASRRKRDNLVMLKSPEEYKTMTPDAVTIAVIAIIDGKPHLLLNYEFRYATAEYILAPPAGLIDKEDGEGDQAIINSAIREVNEETGITIAPEDRTYIVNPLVFSSPGMTDESNAIVCSVINNPDLSKLSHAGAVGSEEFDGFELVDLEMAQKLLKDGRDKYGNFYSVYTYVCLMYFVSKMWES